MLMHRFRPPLSNNVTRHPVSSLEMSRLSSLYVVQIVLIQITTTPTEASYLPLSKRYRKCNSSREHLSANRINKNTYKRSLKDWMMNRSTKLLSVSRPLPQASIVILKMARGLKRKERLSLSKTSNLSIKVEK